VLAQMRAVKDPLRAAFAARRLSASSRVRVTQLGPGRDARLATRARGEARRNPRYRWRGEVAHARALRALARCDLLVVSSLQEGGANVIGEAAVLGVPILASRIDGNVGLLGARHPGYFPARDTRALTALLRRAETDERFLAGLERASRRTARLFRPERERAAWRRLLAELDPRAQSAQVRKPAKTSRRSGM
jgi:glycosyltransferase involved in cell wall biosynthesis